MMRFDRVILHIYYAFFFSCEKKEDFSEKLGENARLGSLYKLSLRENLYQSLRWLDKRVHTFDSVINILFV